MENKKTKRELFTELLAIATNDEQKAFINHELELLAKKHDNKKMTKAQEENSKVKELIFTEIARFNKPVTVSQLQGVPDLKEYTNQKISALIKQLVENGDVVRTEEKRVAYFNIAPIEEEEEEGEIEEDATEDTEEDATENQ